MFIVDIVIVHYTRLGAYKPTNITGGQYPVLITLVVERSFSLSNKNADDPSGRSYLDIFSELSMEKFGLLNGPCTNHLSIKKNITIHKC